MPTRFVIATPYSIRGSAISMGWQDAGGFFRQGQDVRGFTLTLPSPIKGEGVLRRAQDDPPMAAVVGGGELDTVTLTPRVSPRQAGL